MPIPEKELCNFELLNYILSDVSPRNENALNKITSGAFERPFLLEKLAI